MAKGEVPLEYGFYVSPPDGPDSNFRAVNFPFAQWFAINGGPKIGERAATTVELYQCRACETAKLQWLANHPISEWAKLETKSYERVVKFRPAKH